VTPLGNSPDFAPTYSPANAGEDIKWLFFVFVQNADLNPQKIVFMAVSMNAGQ
jgi:hypothetical protein